MKYIKYQGLSMFFIYKIIRLIFINNNNKVYILNIKDY